MPRESYDIRTLRAKAIASLRVGVTAFNSLDDDARLTKVLLHLQHSFEMLLKAGLLSTGAKSVFDRKKRMAIGMEACINKCQQDPSIKLTETEAGTLRVLDNLRDGEQHWHQVVDEGVLYLHARAAVTLFDDLLQRIWGLHLAEYIPSRVLPLSAEPPQDLGILVDREYSRIRELLQPGRRATAEAKGRVRTLLATEALADPDAIEISDADVNRIVRGVREGKSREQIFPKLSGLSASMHGEGLALEVRFVKKDGLPVTFTSDPDSDVAAIREVDLEKKFYMGAYDLADRAGVERYKAVALRRHLGLDGDDDHYSHTFRFGSQRHRRYSDNALRAMKESLPKVDFEKVWQAHRRWPKNARNEQPVCDQPGCVEKGS